MHLPPQSGISVFVYTILYIKTNLPRLQTSFECKFFKLNSSLNVLNMIITRIFFSWCVVNVTHSIIIHMTINKLNNYYINRQYSANRDEDTVQIEIEVNYCIIFLFYVGGRNYSRIGPTNIMRKPHINSAAPCNGTTEWAKIFHSRL